MYNRGAMAPSLILRTRIVPPPIAPRTLVRQRVLRALQQTLHYRLTLVHAGAGYGKSTALQILAAHHAPLIWYQVSEEDSDLLLFLQYLCHATQLALPELQNLPIDQLEAWESRHGLLPSTQILVAYVNALAAGLQQPTLLVMDDVHQVLQNDDIALLINHLVAQAPPHLHIVLASRQPVRLPDLPYWRSQGAVLDIGQHTLAFTAEEIRQLFSQSFACELDADEADELLRLTEGWAITLPLIWQNMRAGASIAVAGAPAHAIASLDDLFTVLAQEILNKQPADVRAFLLASATLEAMTPESCDAVREASDSAAMLAYLQRQELFVSEQADGSLRYHPVFRRFLRQRSDPAQRMLWHKRAAAYARARGERDAAIYHLLQAQNYPEAAALLESFGFDLLVAGRLDSLAAYLDALPPSELAQHPTLLCYLGDLARLHSRFEQALNWYTQAETLARERGLQQDIARALRGQARVYLDTVNPSKAEHVLQQALRLSDGANDRETQARLYKLLAENKLNLGKTAEAEAYQHKAEMLQHERPTDAQITYRVLLRTGRLHEARQALEQRAAAERQNPVQTPRAHRETDLLLSIIYAFMGEAQLAYKTALAGTARGEKLGSPWVKAVGLMRQGHALQLMNDPPSLERAGRCYQGTIDLSHQLGTPRLQVESMMGLARLHSLQGDLSAAQHDADIAIDIATQAGDEWIAAMVRIMLASGLALAQRYEQAIASLQRARHGFSECSDPFGMTAAALWLSLIWQRQQAWERLDKSLEEVLSACRRYGYDFLFTRPTLLGPPDERLLVPLLIYAREHDIEASTARHILGRLGLHGIQLHPGYQLRVFTLGDFQVWRGRQRIPANGWRRESARLLFQLLLSYYDEALERDQIIELLWPDVPYSKAKSNFKVALGALYNILEPERVPGSDSAYVRREGSRYRLRPQADLWLDARAFLETLSPIDAPDAASIPELEQAVNLYKGEYLPNARYESWAAPLREQLTIRFLQAADQLCALYLQEGRPQPVLNLCQRILAIDNCWERAYRHLMLAYHALGDGGQVARTYQRCAETLKNEMGISPTPETKGLFRQLVERV